MDLLTASQIFFNFTVSFAVILVTVVLCGLIYEIMNLIGSIRRFFNNLHHKSEEMYDNIHHLLKKISSTVEGLAAVPFAGLIARLFKKRSSKKEKERE